MPVSSVRILDAETTQLAAKIDGVEWTGIRCHLDGETIVIDGDGEIPDAVKAWLADGGLPTPFVSPPLTEADYGAAVQAHIEATARACSYRDAATCASYIGSTIAAWQADAEAFVAWRDSVWTYVYAQLAAVLAEERAQPTIDDLIAELPSITWP